MALLLFSLVFLGPPGCGCGDTEPPEIGGTPCCCTFIWAVPSDPIFGPESVQIVIPAQTPGLNAVANPNLLVNVSSGTQQTFQVCVSTGHPLGASAVIEFRTQAGGTLLGGATLVYSETCTPTIQPAQGTVIWSPDCGQIPECCCDLVWYPDPFLQDASVNVFVAGLSAGITPVFTPSTLTGVNQNVASAFTVCVNVDHPLGATIDVELRDAVNSTVYGTFSLVYIERCVPTVVPGLRTDIYSPDCGTVPQCCCEVNWFYAATAGPTLDVRLEFVMPDPSLNPMATPAVVTGLLPGNTAPFQVCVDLDHTLGATMTIRVVDNTSGAELATLPVTYLVRCEATPGQQTGQGLVSVNCSPDLGDFSKSR